MSSSRVIVLTPAEARDLLASLGLSDPQLSSTTVSSGEAVERVVSCPLTLPQPPSCGVACARPSSWTVTVSGAW